jgi:eukaryotic-like serine/threonine-protein kinase
VVGMATPAEIEVDVAFRGVAPGVGRGELAHRGACMKWIRRLLRALFGSPEKRELRRGRGLAPGTASGRSSAARGENRQTDVEIFLQLVLQSKLLETKQLEEVLTQIKEETRGQPIANVAILCKRLVEKGVLTSWQCQKLAEGRHKGFFLGSYKLLDWIGAGSTSSVYLAEHLLMQRQVAIRVLPRNRAQNTSYATRFLREAKVAAALDHRNVVRVYDADTDTETHYLVMEYVKGRNLQRLVEEEGPLAFKRTAKYVLRAAEGLYAAHTAGLIHRNVKPANLLVDDNDVLKILDFGVVRLIDDATSPLAVAYDDNVLGTADYLAPEQVIDSQSVDARTDIYALGCTMFFLLTGRPPFGKGTLPQRLMDHQRTPPPDIRKSRPDVSRELIAICLKMMAKKPEDRFQTADEVARSLRDWLGDEDGGAGSRVPNPTSPPALDNHAGPDSPGGTPRR